MKLYQARLTDIAKVLPLYCRYLDFYHVAHHVADAEAFLSARTRQGESVIYLVEDDAGEAVGFAQLYPLFCSLEMKRIWLLYDLYVSASARRAGVAQMLLDQAQKLGVNTDAAFIMLSTATDNLSAQALYEKNGYVRDQAFYTYNRQLNDAR
jgi:ribosomal protein S18 acetylase RimI-like enzyme